jgi:hypothetical protein
MKRDVITIYEARSIKAHGCHNCVHRYGGITGREFWRCTRTGTYVSTEMKFGGKCSIGGDLMLWAPRQGLLQKLFHLIVRGEK